MPKEVLNTANLIKHEPIQNNMNYDITYVTCLYSHMLKKYLLHL